jgi:multidrug efflux system membrane fusion protein
LNVRHLAASGLLFAAVVALAAGCRPAKPAQPAPPPPTVTVARPAPATVQNYLEYNGWLDAVDSVQVKARVKGVLTEVLFKEGDEVEEGTPLFKIDPREYDANVKKAKADRDKAIANIKSTKALESRAKSLLAKGTSTQEEVDKLTADRETAEALLMQADAALDQAKLERSYADLDAPIAGQISRALVTRGNLVGQNEATLLTTIVGVHPLYVFFDVPERDLVEEMKAVRDRRAPSPISRSIPIEVGVITEEGYPHAGVIDFRENRVDPGTGTVRLRGRVPNPPLPPNNARELYPGLYARVRVPVGSVRELPAIPEEALMSGQEGRFVYVIDDQGVVEKRSVTVGPKVWSTPPPGSGRAPEWTLTGPEGAAQPLRSVVAIEKGLGPKDRVVVNGLQKVRPGAPAVPDEWAFKGPATKK